MKTLKQRILEYPVSLTSAFTVVGSVCLIVGATLGTTGAVWGMRDGLRDSAKPSPSAAPSVSAWPPAEFDSETPRIVRSAEAIQDPTDRQIEVDKNLRWDACVAKHGVPVMGFGFTVVCIDEENVQIINGKRY